MGTSKVEWVGDGVVLSVEMLGCGLQTVRWGSGSRMGTWIVGF
tara:strand:- start:4434 stop:4562 length:129 start_codon:yes stop_codon:yes gene_type:complete